jgi:hypothetical protein
MSEFGPDMDPPVTDQVLFTPSLTDPFMSQRLAVSTLGYYTPWQLTQEFQSNNFKK